MNSLVEVNSINGKYTALLEKNCPVNIDIGDFAERLLNWMRHGHIEHKDGEKFDMCNTVKVVLISESFTFNPKQVSSN